MIKRKPTRKQRKLEALKQELLKEAKNSSKIKTNADYFNEVKGKLMVEEYKLRYRLKATNISMELHNKLDSNILIIVARDIFVKLTDIRQMPRKLSRVINKRFEIDMNLVDDTLGDSNSNVVRAIINGHECVGKAYHILSVNEKSAMLQYYFVIPKDLDLTEPFDRVVFESRIHGRSIVTGIAY